MTQRCRARGGRKDADRRVGTYACTAERVRCSEAMSALNEKSIQEMVSGPQRCDWSQFHSLHHRGPGERSQRSVPPPPPPPPPRRMTAWNWDRWLHSDRISPNLVLIYTVHITDFYNMTRKASMGADSPGFHTSTGLTALLIIPDRSYHLRATHTHPNVTSLQHHLETFYKHTEMNSVWRSPPEHLSCDTHCWPISRHGRTPKRTCNISCVPGQSIPFFSSHHVLTGFHYILNPQLLVQTRSLLLGLWAAAAGPLWATAWLSCGNTSKCCLRQPRSPGQAPADKLWPSALMTYRLKRRGIHVSEQCHGPAAETVGGGEKHSPWLLPIPAGTGLAPGLCHMTLPSNRPQMKDVKCKNGEGGEKREGGGFTT